MNNCENRRLNRPFPSDRKYSKMQVCVKAEDGSIKNIHFGHKEYKHNYSRRAWESYMARSAGIRDSEGNLTKDNPLSANYWARKILWSRKK